MMLRALALAAALLAAGCTGTSSAFADHTGTTPSAAPTHAVTTTTPGGPGRFVAKVRATRFWSKHFAGATDAEVLRVGRAACDGLVRRVTYSHQVDAFAISEGMPSVHQAAVLVDEAIRDLCPQYSRRIPPGAA